MEERRRGSEGRESSDRYQIIYLVCPGEYYLGTVGDKVKHVDLSTCGFDVDSILVTEVSFPAGKIIQSQCGMPRTFTIFVLFDFLINKPKIVLTFAGCCS